PGAAHGVDCTANDCTADEITLSSYLADHASSVLKTARVMAALAEAARTSAEAEESAAAQAATLQRLVEVEEQLTPLVLTGQGVSAVKDTISQMLDAEVLVVDSGRLDSPDFPAEERFFDGIA